MKKTMKLTLVVISVFMMLCTLRAQVVFEPLNKDIYSYLERLSNKGIIELDDLFKPLSRKYMAEKLVEAKGKI